MTYVGVLGVANQVVVGRLSRAFGPARLDRRGSTFGVTQGAGRLGRTLGPAMAARYVLRVWAPFACLVRLVLVFGGGAAARGRAAPG